MLGSFGNSLSNNGIESVRGRPPFKAAVRDAKKLRHQFNQLLEAEWSELPYAMMRITAARRPWDGNRVYWRDHNVQLGDVDLNLIKTRAEDVATTYAASYGHEEFRREFALHPSLEDDQLSWTAPGICNGEQLTTQQLAERLLSRLVTFYSTGLFTSMTISPASPGPAS